MLRTAEWPPDRPVPQVSIEFDVADAAAVIAAAQELLQLGYELLHPSWRAVGPDRGETASLEGAIVGVSYAPALHDQY